jgi:hypothetical protein
MSYPELSEGEVADLVGFIVERTKELERIEGGLDGLARSLPRLSVEVLESQPSVRAAVMDARASLLSNVTTVLSSVSSVIQKFRIVPSSLLNALLNFLTAFWRIISKYIGIFKIDSITITISTTPSVVVVLKP